MKRVLYNMSGPRIRAIIDEMIPMTPEEREARIKQMKTNEMRIIVGVFENSIDQLDQIYEVILWGHERGRMTLEVKSRR